MAWRDKYPPILAKYFYALKISHRAIDKCDGPRLGMAISKRQVVRLLIAGKEDFLAEAAGVQERARERGVDHGR